MEGSIFRKGSFLRKECKQLWILGSILGITNEWHFGYCSFIHICQLLGIISEAHSSLRILLNSAPKKLYKIHWNYNLGCGSYKQVNSLTENENYGSTG